MNQQAFSGEEKDLEAWSNFWFAGAIILMLPVYRRLSLIIKSKLR